MKLNTYFLISALFLTAFSASAQTYTFDFTVDHHDFEGGVSDFHVDQSDQHQFTFDHRNFQPPLDTMQVAQYISAVNPSDDLFMYMKREIKGLQPHTTYQVTFIVEFASKYPTNAFGVGGPPGEGVTMKAGLTHIEPDTVIEEKGGAFVTMNIDKGNQSAPGPDMDTIGHVGVTDTTTVWAIKTNDNVGHPFTFTTDASGSAWLIIGTDSGFEAQTELFFTMVTVDFTISTSVTDGLQPEDILIYPNPSSGQVYVSAERDLDVIRIYDTSGRLFRSYMMKGSDVAFYLPRSDYLLKITSGASTVVKRLIVK